MITKKSFYLLPFAVLLFLTLITTASTAGSPVSAEQSVRSQELTVYINAIHNGKGGASITTDEIDWYEGTAADRIFANREPEAAAEIGGAPDGYYIVNDSDTLTDYPVARDAKVIMQIYDHTGNPADLDLIPNERVTFQQFKKLLAKTDVIDLSQFPYHITIDGGVVTSIVQQYIP